MVDIALFNLIRADYIVLLRDCTESCAVILFLQTISANSRLEKASRSA
jgi:hypothetical protein